MDNALSLDTDFLQQLLSVLQETLNSTSENPVSEQQFSSDHPLAFNKRIKRTAAKIWVSPSEWSQLVVDYKLLSDFLSANWSKLPESCRKILIDLSQAHLNTDSEKSSEQKKSKAFLNIFKRKLRFISLQYASLTLERDFKRNLTNELLSAADELSQVCLEKAGMTLDEDSSSMSQFLNLFIEDIDANPSILIPYTREMDASFDELLAGVETD